MNPKASATLEKACEDRRRSNFKKALSRLEEGIEKFPKEIRLYTEAIDVGMESGESLKAIQFFKKAQQKLPDDGFELWTFSAEKVGTYNDPIVGRFLVEQAIRNGDLPAASSLLENLKDHAAGELLERIKTKKQTVSGSLATGVRAREETVSYTLIEALLCLRLNRISEAMDGFVRAIDENPDVCQALGPFLADVESQHGEKGETSYALGCCYLASAAYSKGLDRLVHAARSAPSLASGAIERIEALEEHPELPVEVRNLNLAQLYIGRGESRRASDLLRTILDRNPLKAPDILDVLRPVVEQLCEDLDPQFLFVEASFAAGRRETALGQLRKIHQNRAHRSRLVEWLESRSHSEKGSIEIQLFFAETALNEGLHGKAIEIVKEILSQGPQEEPAIRELLSKHQSVPLVRHFYNERFSASLARQKRSNFEFERYDGHGFPPVDAQTPPRKDPVEREKPHSEENRTAGDASIRVDDFSFGKDEPHPPRAIESSRSDFDNRDFSLSMHAATAPTAEEPLGEDANGPRSPANGSDLFEYLKRDFAAHEPPANDIRRSDETASPVEPDPSLTDEFERAGSGRVTAPDEGEQGPDSATPGFETTLSDEPAPSARDDFKSPPEERAGAARDETVDVPDEAAEPPTEPADLPRDFDSLYRQFLDGGLDRGRVLEVVERAFDEDRMDEMKKLLSFEPANLGEDIARKYHLARYYLAKDQPVSALVALKTVHLNALSREERKNFLLRIADCYRALHNFEAAHGVYLRIMSDYPGLPDVERIAQSNYDQYIATAAGAALTLEKVTTL